MTGRKEMMCKAMTRGNYPRLSHACFISSAAIPLQSPLPSPAMQPVITVQDLAKSYRFSKRGRGPFELSNQRM